MKRYKIGAKFYHLDDDGNLIIIRLKKFDEAKNVYSFVDENNTGSKEYIKLTKEEITSNYVHLVPDGYVTFTIVRLGKDFKDVVIGLYRNQDLSSYVPYAVCRQNVSDYFSNLLTKNQNIMGMSVSQNNCPAEINFETMLACDEVLSTDMMSVYMDDSIQDILNFIPNKKYDAILRGLKQKAMVVAPHLEGYEDTLKGLIIKNRFMFDFHMAFGILEIAFPILENQESLSEYQIAEVNKGLGLNIMSTYVLKFSKDINLKDLNKSFFLAVCPENPKDIYIVGYDEMPKS